MRATTAFLEDEVPAMVGSIRQWALSGTDPVTAEKAAQLRRILNESQDALRRVCLETRMLSMAQASFSNI